MWQALRNELHPKGFELVTVGLDTLGAEGCRTFIEAAHPEHPSLIDQYHRLAEQFGVINIPSAVWIDEHGMIVRPAEVAPAPPQPGRQRRSPPNLPPETPQRLREMMQEAGKIPNDDAEHYHAALRDWVEHGSESRFAMSPDEVIARSRPRDANRSLGHAHFELASALEITGHHGAAIEHFREAHRLVPESWTFRRQAWSLETVEEAGPFARFWQGPKPDDPESWPYEGGWLEDVRKEGAENYNARWKP